jgi:hypothetical protein
VGDGVEEEEKEEKVEAILCSRVEIGGGERVDERVNEENC